MPKVRRGDDHGAVETEDSKNSDTKGGVPASPLTTTGRKRQQQRSHSPQHKERKVSSLSPYRTRSRSQSQMVLQTNNCSVHSQPLFKGLTRSDATAQSSKLIPFRGGQHDEGAKSSRRRRSNLYDSGFAMDDEADDEKAVSQGHFSQGANLSPRVQKKARSDRRGERLNTVVSTVLPKVSSPKRRKVETPSTRIYGYYQPQSESDLSSDSESSDDGDLTENHDKISSTTCSSSSDLSSTSSSSSDAEDDEQFERSASTSESSERSVSTTKPSIKVAPVRPTRPKVQTKIITTTTATAAVTAAPKKIIFGNPSRHFQATQKTIHSTLPTAPFPPPPPIPALQRPPQPISRSSPIRPFSTITPLIQSRSRPPRQVRVKTGRWTRAEDAALYEGVVAYLNQYGLEPKPPAHLPLHEDPKQQDKQEKVEGNDHEHDVAGRENQSTSERLAEERNASEIMAMESRERLDYETAPAWRESTGAAYQMSEQQCITDIHDYTSESEAAVRERESDTYRLFEELVDVSCDNVHVEDGSGGSGQDGPLFLEPQASQHTSLLSPLHIGSSFDQGQVPEFNIRSLFDGHDLKPDMIHVKMDVHYNHNHGNLYHQQQQYLEFQQEYYHQHFRHLNQAYSDQTNHMEQQRQQHQGPIILQNHYQQPQYQQHGIPSIPPQWSELTMADQSGDDVWLARIGGENMTTPEIRTVTLRDNALTLEDESSSGGIEASDLMSNNNRSRRAIFEEAAIEMALFEDLFPGTGINTTTNNTSPSSSHPATIFNTNPHPDQSCNTPPTTANIATRYKSQDAYSSAISRRIATCPWSQIASLTVPGRTGVQAQARWSEALDPRVKKGPWSPEEDALLLEGVERSDKCWIWIADMIEGRTQRQCRTRWVQLTIEAERRAALAALEGVPQF